jgi:hypothetical protein
MVDLNRAALSMSWRRIDGTLRFRHFCRFAVDRYFMLMPLFSRGVNSRGAVF